MSMNLKLECPHCTAGIGQMCTKECSANGKHIIKLEACLNKIDLSLEDIQLKPCPVEGE